ncbi:hypothetical protein ABIF66_005116 [Bradyrhizobium japonicum]
MLLPGTECSGKSRFACGKLFAVHWEGFVAVEPGKAQFLGARITPLAAAKNVRQNQHRGRIACKRARQKSRHDDVDLQRHHAQRYQRKRHTDGGGGIARQRSGAFHAASHDGKPFERGGNLEMLCAAQ